MFLAWSDFEGTSARSKSARKPQLALPPELRKDRKLHHFDWYEKYQEETMVYRPLGYRQLPGSTKTAIALPLGAVLSSYDSEWQTLCPRLSLHLFEFQV